MATTEKKRAYNQRYYATRKRDSRTELERAIEAFHLVERIGWDIVRALANAMDPPR